MPAFLNTVWGAVVLLITMGIGYALGAFSRYQPSAGRHRAGSTRSMWNGRRVS